ncbi:hypothetical protein [Actinoplanes xinjiangensis]|uniref:hypothetical protein n=1 Tax=Actinoplanes xinjiangensis TaxID=512350 RepID=UPI0034477BEF
MVAFRLLVRPVSGTGWRTVVPFGVESRTPEAYAIMRNARISGSGTSPAPATLER